MKGIKLSVLMTALLCQLGLAAMTVVAAEDDSWFDVKSPSTFLYTDKLVYLPGQYQTLTMVQDGSLNPFPYENLFNSYFLYLENLQTGVKTYQAYNNSYDTVRDLFGNPADAAGGHYPIYRVPTGTFNWFGAGGIFGGPKRVPSQPGSYRWVMELRDTRGVYISSQGFAPFTVVSEITPLSGHITSDTTLYNTQAYILNGIVFVDAPATLTIEPGTIIYGDTDSQGGLCITQGAKIHAVGTSRRPIVFTSSASVGERVPGDWFGVAIAGKATINVTGGTGQVEGIETVSYGGDDDDDDSGIMSYVRIEYAGFQFTPDREANGLYLNAVGRKTIFDHMHFNQNADDNIEFFGGVPQVKYVYCTGGGDDQFDWTEGFRGKAQFVITHVFKNSAGNRGIEADNWQNDNNAEPRSNPMVYNMTIVGPQQDYGEGEGKADHGLMLRRGTAGKLYNFIVIGYGRDGINITDAATVEQANSGNLVFDNAILFNNGVFGSNGVGPFGNQNTQNWIQSKSTKVFTDLDPHLVDPYNEITPDYRPGYESPALRIDIVKVPPDDGFFEHVDFIGGMSPYYNWLAGGWAYVTPW